MKRPTLPYDFTYVKKFYAEATTLAEKSIQNSDSGNQIYVFCPANDEL